MCEGDAKGRVFTFPIPTYNITRNFDWDNPTLEYLWEATAKYGIPYFSNFVNSDLDPNDARSMCCRLRLDTRKLEARGGGLFGANPLTGSIGVVTINMPRLAYTSQNITEFFQNLTILMEQAKNSLEIKRKVLENLTSNNLYPYTKYYLRDIKKRFDQYWKNHFSTIGLIGVNEACLNLIGENVGIEKGQKFAVKIMDFMREKLIDFQGETGNNYNLEATPAESTTYRLARLDKAKYPEIIVANEEEYQKGAEPFYTNSTQLPVNFSEDIFETLELQDDIQTKYTGGTVLHLYAGERVQNTETIKNLVNKVCSNFKLPYFTFSPTFSICKEHGYLNGEHEECPYCGKACEVYARVVGYLRPVQQWNDGKKAEFKMRKNFKVVD
jgi:ribonucleoside-triphosphate reductase